MGFNEPADAFLADEHALETQAMPEFAVSLSRERGDVDEFAEASNKFLVAPGRAGPAAPDLLAVTVNGRP